VTISIVTFAVVLIVNRLPGTGSPRLASS
jgi:hypothetical protein